MIDLSEVLNVSIVVDWSWWLSFAITLAGFIAVIFELREMRKQYSAIKDQQEQEKKNIRISNSIALAEKYQKLIQEDQNFIVRVLMNQDVYKELINQIEYSDLIQFDGPEFNRLAKRQTNLSKYKDGILNVNTAEEFIDSIVSAVLSDPTTPIEDYVIIHDLNLSNWKLTDDELTILHSNYSELDENDQTRFNVLSRKNAYLNYYYIKLISLFQDHCLALLNKLEAFSMNITTNIADENIIYQSLHQSFLSVVKMLYPNICKLNVGDNADKYYTHLISVYNRWSKRYANDLKNELNAKNSEFVDPSSKF